MDAGAGVLLLGSGCAATSGRRDDVVQRSAAAESAGAVPRTVEERGITLVTEEDETWPESLREMPGATAAVEVLRRRRLGVALVSNEFGSNVTCGLTSAMDGAQLTREEAPRGREIAVRFVLQLRDRGRTENVMVA